MGVARGNWAGLGEEALLGRHGWREGQAARRRVHTAVSRAALQRTLGGLCVDHDDDDDNDADRGFHDVEEDEDDEDYM